MRLLTSLLIAAGACSAQEQDFMSSIGTFVTSYKAAIPAETTEDDKTPARRKLIKRVLPVAVASTALGVAAFK